MHLSYNGVEFRILTITDYIREAVFTEDETTFLFDHIGIRCLAWLNVDATQVPGTPPNAGCGLSEVALVSLLQQHRAPLVIWMDSGLDDGNPVEVLLTSPYPNGKTDAKFGPTCSVHGLQTDHGNGSLVVDLEFHTDVASCGGVMTNSTSVVLANRWKYLVTYDPDNYAEVRKITGEAIFRMDNLLAVLNGDIDSTRQFLVPPPLPGFQREAPVFEVSSAGNAIRYEIVDTQKPRSFPIGQAFNAAHIEIIEDRSYDRPQVGANPLSWMSSL